MRPNSVSSQETSNPLCSTLISNSVLPMVMVIVSRLRSALYRLVPVAASPNDEPGSEQSWLAETLVRVLLGESADAHHQIGVDAVAQEFSSGSCGFVLILARLLGVERLQRSVAFQVLDMIPIVAMETSAVGSQSESRNSGSKTSPLPTVRSLDSRLSNGCDVLTLPVVRSSSYCLRSST